MSRHFLFLAQRKRRIPSLYSCYGLVLLFYIEQSGTPKGEIPPRIEQTMVIPPTLTPLASEPVTSVVPPVAQAPQTQLSTSPELPENPVSVVETPTPKAKIQPEVKKVAGFDEIIDKTSMASVGPCEFCSE